MISDVDFTVSARWCRRRDRNRCEMDGLAAGGTNPQAGLGADDGRGRVAGGGTLGNVQSRLVGTGPRSSQMSPRPFGDHGAIGGFQVGGRGLGIARGCDRFIGDRQDSTAFGAFALFRRRQRVDLQATAARTQKAPKPVRLRRGDGIDSMSNSYSGAAFGTDDPLVPSWRDRQRHTTTAACPRHRLRLASDNKEPETMVFPMIFYNREGFGAIPIEISTIREVSTAAQPRGLERTSRSSGIKVLRLPERKPSRSRVTNLKPRA